MFPLDNESSLTTGVVALFKLEAKTSSELFLALSYLQNGENF